MLNEDGIYEDYITTKNEEELLLPPTAFLGEHYRDVLPPQVSKQLEASLTKLDQGKEQDKFDYPLDIQGKKQWFVAVVTKVHFEDESRYLLSARNITERKKAEKALVNKNQELKDLNRQKDKLLSVVSHDLKNAISGAVGIQNLMLEDFEELSRKEIYEYLEILDKRTRETIDLLEDLLLWSRDKFQGLEANREQFNLYDISNEVIEHVAPRAEDKDINLINRIPEETTVFADINMLKAVLRNLLANAIKFSHPGDEVTVRAEQSNQEVEISVIDEGMGIEEEALGKIFNKKETYTTKGTDGESGSGIGLDLCIDFVEKHSGDFRVESKPGEGSTFRFTLPTKS